LTRPRFICNLVRSINQSINQKRFIWATCRKRIRGARSQGL